VAPPALYIPQMLPTVGPPHRLCPDGQAGRQLKQVLFAAEQLVPKPVRV